MRLLAPLRRITEAITSRIVAPLRDELGAERQTSMLLSETVADLERRLHEPGWVRFVALAEQEFSPEGMRQLRAICQLFALKNPLIKRGLTLRAAYVWGQGVEIAARSNGSDGTQDVQAVIQEFLDDPDNVRAFSGAEAREQLERTLGTDGEVFLAMFTRPTTGQVQVRPLPADEIVEVICDPQDRTKPWFYRRRWLETSYTSDGSQETRQREVLYPCVDHRPGRRPPTFAGVEVDWWSPVIHVAVNKPMRWQRGVPDVYAAIDWANAYKEFLEDWALVVKSLSRFSWRLTARGSGRRQAKERLAERPPRDRHTGQERDTGATAVMGPEQVLEAIPKSGATIDAESGRPLAMMVASALDLPITMLLEDPGQTGARATAETLDQPTELTMNQRRQVWASTLRSVLGYVILQSVRAPKGTLQGRLVRDTYYDRETVELAGDSSTVIDITWPDLDEIDPAQVVSAVVEASSTGTMRPELVLRLLLTALGVEDVDDLVKEMVDPGTGEFLWPSLPSIGGEGQRAADLVRAGGDPLDAGPGPMGTTNDDDVDDDDDDDDGGGGT